MISIAKYFWVICIIATSMSANAFPKLFMESGELLDMMGEMQTKTEIPKGWKDELKARLPEFQLAWDQNAEALSQTSESLCGCMFSRKEYSVALVLGPYLPMARPFLMNMQPYLDASNEPSHVQSMSAFVMLTHHELLHHLLENTENEKFQNFSAMIKKYKIESQPGFKVESNENVLAHIHLMALQKATYELLGRQDLVNEAAHNYLNVIKGSYAEAWQIVMKEGVTPFIIELQNYNRVSQ